MHVPGALGFCRWVRHHPRHSEHEVVRGNARWPSSDLDFAEGSKGLGDAIVVIFSDPSGGFLTLLMKQHLFDDFGTSLMNI